MRGIGLDETALGESQGWLGAKLVSGRGSDVGCGRGRAGATGRGGVIEPDGAVGAASEDVGARAGGVGEGVNWGWRRCREPLVEMLVCRLTPCRDSHHRIALTIRACEMGYGLVGESHGKR